MSYGWWSILPPIVAICLAILTRRVVASLLLGVVVGVLILQGQSGSVSLPSLVEQLCEQLLWPSLCDPQHLRVFVFTALMGAMIGVIQRSGGMQGVVDALAPWARSRRGGQLLTWLLGLLIFIDDYANSLLLGNTMQPLMDRLRISREKLAYLVDSTAAPVAGLALISTWVAGEIGYIDQGFADVSLPAGMTVDGFSVFVQTIPYRFYVLLALVFVPLVAILGRDFGPMLAAERRALGSSSLTRRDQSDERGGEPQSMPSAHWLLAVIPILVTLAVTIGLLLGTGQREAGPEVNAYESWRALIQVFGAGDSYLALVYGSLSGLLTALLLSRGAGILSWEQARAAAFHGATLVIPALVILWLAWTLSTITGSEQLGTGEFLGSQLREAGVDVRWMPTLVFLLASFVAFATGTSWGTMGILMPIVITTTYAMMQRQLAIHDPHHAVMTASIGSVLAGAIFGDHCSPISDTTVLSSQASGCNHVAHVRTQLPYALLVAAVATVAGTLPVGFGVPVWLLLLADVVILVVLLRLLGRRATTPR